MAVEATEGTDIENACRSPPRRSGAPRPLGEDVCTARLVGLASALLQVRQNGSSPEEAAAAAELNSDGGRS